MTKEEYFGDWSKVIDLRQADTLLKELSLKKQILCPSLKDVFKSFHLCPLHSLRVVLIGQDPYPNLRAFPWDSSQGRVPVATGLAFANSEDTPEDSLSPSLAILKESVINYAVPHRIVTFDQSLKKWAEQGVLLLNAALTCEVGRVGCHMLLWRPFISGFLTNLSKCSSGIVYVLMGNQAQSLEPYINTTYNYILRIQHPSYYSRNHLVMPSDIWRQINILLNQLNGTTIEWYQES